MKTLKLCLGLLALVAVVTLVGCSGTAKQSPDVSDSIRKSLDQAGLKDVSVSQDRDKGEEIIDRTDGTDNHHETGE